METKRKTLPEGLEQAARRSSGVVVKSKPSFTTFLGMAPMLDSIAESMGGGFRVSVGGRELFTSRAYIQLNGSDMPLSRRFIPMEFHECEGTMELVTVDKNSEKLVQMAELALKGDIASGVVHDVNNLLCGVIGNLDLLAAEVRQKAPDMKSAVAEMQVALESITSAMKRMRGILFSKKDLASANVFSVVESALALIKKQLQTEWRMKGKEISVVNAVPKTLWALIIHGDVQLALVNIMLNAVEHGIEKSGKIEIRGYKEGANVIIEVENDGREIPASVRGQLLQKPVTQDCNNGYGLYSSAKTLRNFGGDISYESNPQSTVFTITLPASGTCE